jgi:hypothetical protein
MLLLAPAGGNRVPVIAQLVQADEDTDRVPAIFHRTHGVRYFHGC